MKYHHLALYKVIISILFLFFTCMDLKPYSISIHVHGLNHIKVFLAEYYGNSFYIIDSVKTDEHGKAVLQAHKELPPGTYYLVLPNKNSLELLLGQQQDFTLETSIRDPFNSLNIYGPEETATYVHYQKFIANHSQQIQRLTTELKNNHDNLNTVYRNMKEISLIEKNMVQRKKEIIREHPDWLLSTYLTMSIDNLKEGPVKTMDVEKRFQLYFKSYDFTSPEILRTPIYRKGIRNFLDKYTDAKAGTIAKVTRLILQTNMLTESKSTFLNVMYEYYSQMDNEPRTELFLSAIAQEILNINEKDLHLMFSPTHLYKLKNTLPGSILPEGLSRYIEQNNRTLLAIWNPECTACKQDIMKLKNISIPYHVIVFGGGNADYQEKKPHFHNISVDQQEVFKDFPVEQTPVYFIIDEKNRIIKKSYQIQPFLAN